MTGAVNVNSSPRSKTDFLANAKEAWGESLPEWVEALALEANRTSGAQAAKRIGYSPAVVTAIVRNAYQGDVGAVEARVTGALMGAVVDCPVMGEIPRDRCMAEQKKTHKGASQLRRSLFFACRQGCPHSRIKGGAS